MGHQKLEFEKHHGHHHDREPLLQLTEPESNSKSQSPFHFLQNLDSDEVHRKFNWNSMSWFRAILLRRLLQQDFSVDVLKRLEGALQQRAIRTAAFDVISSTTEKVAVLAASVVLLSSRYGRLNALHFWLVSTLLFMKATGLLISNPELHLRNRLGIQANPNRGTNLVQKIILCYDHAERLFTQFYPLVSFYGIMDILRLKNLPFENSGKESRTVILVFYFVAFLHVWAVQYGSSWLLFNKLGLRLITGNELRISEHAYLLDQYVYHIHSECMKEGLVQSTHTTLVDFAIMKLESNLTHEQHSSLLILNKFESYRSRLIHCPKVLTRLLEIVNWEDWTVILDTQHVCEARCTAANLLLQAVECPTSRSTIASIPGSYEKIFSLFSPHQHLVRCRAQDHEEQSTEVKSLNLKGLKIMRRLASDPMNLEKITHVHHLRSTLERYRDDNKFIVLNENGSEFALSLLETLFPITGNRPES